MTDVDELEGRELDAAVAREVFRREVSWREGEAGTEPVLVEAGEAVPCPPYSRDAGAARAVEEELDRRGLAEDYVDRLLKEERPRLGIVDTLEYRDVWNVLHAAPARRCRAAVAVCRRATR